MAATNLVGICGRFNCQEDAIVRFDGLPLCEAHWRAVCRLGPLVSAQRVPIVKAELAAGQYPPPGSVDVVVDRLLPVLMRHSSAAAE